MRRRGRPASFKNTLYSPSIFSTTRSGMMYASLAAECCRPGLGSSLARSSADRKSTRLNSSHGYISYAVFCLKKKNKPTVTLTFFLIHLRRDNRKHHHVTYAQTAVANAAV